MHLSLSTILWVGSAWLGLGVAVLIGLAGARVVGRRRVPLPLALVEDLEASQARRAELEAVRARVRERIG